MNARRSQASVLVARSAARVPLALALAFVVAPLGARTTPVQTVPAAQTGGKQADPGLDTAVLLALATRGDEAAERALVERGEPAALAILVDFEAHSPLERRARARIVERAGGERCIGRGLALLADPDAVVRATLVRFLARPELAQADVAARIAHVADLVRGDPDALVRSAAAHALVEIGGSEALAALDACVDDLAGPERAETAALVTSSVHGRELARARLERAASGADTTAVFAALLAPCARSGADFEHGFETARERAPIAVGLKHPDPRVRRAAQAALDTLVSRLVGLQEHERAIALLLAFEREGLDTCRSLEERARIALLSGVHDDDALGCARSLDTAARLRSGPGERTWRARAAELEALAQIARGDTEAAEAPLLRAAAWTEAALAERLDLQSPEGRREHVRLCLERSSIAVTEAVRRLALALPRDVQEPPARVDPEALVELRRAHTLALEAQLCAWRGEVDAPSTFDPVLGYEIGAHELVLDVRRHAAWPPRRSMALRIALGRALASVAPLEVIGFEPYPSTPPESSDPVRDPVRRQLLVNLRTAECDQLANSLSKERRKVLHTAIEDPAGVEPEDRLALGGLEMRLEEALDAQRRAQAGDDSDMAELRTPSSYFSWTARALRDEGRAADARPFLLKARAQLDGSEVAQRFFWGLEMQAEIEMMLGGSWSDDGDPKKAELELSKAVQRLSALEDTLRERGAAPATLAVISNERCSALVSLAVNANVQLGDPKTALAWFEQAWALRKDDFMRVLLACYRARDGRALEARALLREVTPGPTTFYNMACTHALLGEREPALEFLRRELEENHPTAGALARQKEWARTDPDLASLRDDPGFRALVGSSK